MAMTPTLALARYHLGRSELSGRAWVRPRFAALQRAIATLEADAETIPEIAPRTLRLTNAECWRSVACAYSSREAELRALKAERSAWIREFPWLRETPQTADAQRAPAPRTPATAEAFPGAPENACPLPTRMPPGSPRTHGKPVTGCLVPRVPEEAENALRPEP